MSLDLRPGYGLYVLRPETGLWPVLPLRPGYGQYYRLDRAMALMTA